MSNITTYRCEVDLYRNGTLFRGPKEKLYDRNTTGVYLVGAKNPKEARRLLQKAIGFGSITVPWRSQWRPDGITPEDLSESAGMLTFQARQRAATDEDIIGTILA